MNRGLMIKLATGTKLNLYSLSEQLKAPGIQIAVYLIEHCGH